MTEAGRCLLTGGADTPERDFGFVDDEAIRGGRLEAGCCADSAIDVGGDATHAAHNVVVIVTHTSLEQRRASRGFDPASQTSARQRRERVVDRLGRDRPQPHSDQLRDLVNSQMATLPAKH